MQHMYFTPCMAYHITFVASVGQGDIVNLALSGDGLDGLGIVRSERRQIRLRIALRFSNLAK